MKNSDLILPTTHPYYTQKNTICQLPMPENTKKIKNIFPKEKLPHILTES